MGCCIRAGSPACSCARCSIPGVPRFQNLDTHVGGRIIAKPMNEFRARREALNWEDFRWLRELWPRKLFLKGVLRADDALHRGAARR